MSATRVLTDPVCAQYQECKQKQLRVCFRSEAGVLVGTALLGRMVRHVQSAALLDELVNYILGRETEGELRLDTETHVLRYHLIEHCDHVSDEVGKDYGCAGYGPVGEHFTL